MSNQPYIGLRPFERFETDIFFGRETHSDELINRLGSNHFLAVIGTSGCGKSSLVKTGLIAGLEAGYLAKAGTHWQIVEMRPGQQPFQALAEKLLAELTAVLPAHETVESLAAKLRQGSLSLHELLAQNPLPNNAQLLIVCDQFEEIFRYFQHGEAAEARNFVSLLLASSKPYPLEQRKVSDSMYIIITMRSDFLGDCAQFAGLAEAINQGLYLTPRLDAQQLRAAIEEPAFGFGGEVEPALVTQLLEDAGNNPDQLPLLQHILMRLWDLSKDKQLTVANYQAIGGLKGQNDSANALSRHADEIYARLNDAQKRIAEIMFRALTERADSQRDTRRPLPLAEIVALTEASFAEVVAVIDEFRQTGRCFLMPPINVSLKNDSVIDISHESFIRQWQMLQRWVEDEAENAKTYLRLEDRAIGWKNQRDSLLQSLELGFYQKWMEDNQPTILWAKRYGEDFALTKDFLNISQIAYQQEQQNENKKRNLLIQALICFCIAISVLAGFSVWEWQQAKTNEITAQRQKRLAEHLENLARKSAQLAEQQTRIAKIEKQKAADNTKTALTAIDRLTYDFVDTLMNLTGDMSPIIKKTILFNISLLDRIDTFEAVREKAVNFNRLADVYLQLKDTQNALIYYQKALNINENLATQYEKDAQVQWNLSINFGKLADIYLQSGNTLLALKYYQKALKILQDLTEQDKQNEEMREGLSASFEGLADAYN